MGTKKAGKKVLMGEKKMEKETRDKEWRTEQQEQQKMLKREERKQEERTDEKRRRQRILLEQNYKNELKE